MKTKYPLFALAFLAIICQSKTHADAPAPASPTVSDLRMQNLKGYTYAFVSGQTSLAKIQDAIALLMPKVDAAVDSGALRPVGPYVFTYHGASADPNKQFTLDIGVIVKDPAAKPAGIQIAKIAPLYCASVIFTGPPTQLGQAYGKLYGELARRGLQPTDISREFYLYWEGPDSMNNIIQVQADLTPTNQPNQLPTN